MNSVYRKSIPKGGYGPIGGSSRSAKRSRRNVSTAKAEIPAVSYETGAAPTSRSLPRGDVEMDMLLASMTSMFIPVE